MKRYTLLTEDRDIPALGRAVESGEVVEIDDLKLSAKFDAQPDVWEHMPDPKRSAAAKKAASNSKDGE